MLILERKLGERIVIDGDIYVQVLSITRTNIKLGFEAPDEIGILREELLCKNHKKCKSPKVED